MPGRPGEPLVAWLKNAALPRWSTTGTDFEAGGFFEKIDLDGRPVDEPRRARVVGRQIYVFATAARHGWSASAAGLVEHGLTFLLTKMRLPDGTFAAAVQPDGTVVRADFDLYEQAFVLFALAAAYRNEPHREALREAAEALLARLRAGWGHPFAGFEESAPRSLPLKSNPHMHLLEAALAWRAVSAGAARERWHELADELVTLCLDRFIDANGALHEYFDGDWRPMPGRAGRVVEPGHQFEWAWLLMRWADATGSSRAAAAARRLLDIGETSGVDAERGVAVDELDADLHLVEASAKLWPQTERVKAWHLAAAAGDVAAAPTALTAAIQGLSRYLIDSPRGLWHEQLDAEGRFALQHCRASSLYHIVCAIDALQGGYADDGDGVPPTIR